MLTLFITSCSPLFSQQGVTFFHNKTHQPWHEPAPWHIALEVNVNGRWEQVQQYTGNSRNDEVSIKIGRGSLFLSSKCRHNVQLQRAVIEDFTVYTKFRYLVGPRVNCEFFPVRKFYTYEEALQWHRSLGLKGRLIIEEDFK